MEKYLGREDELWQALAEKYGFEPGQPLEQSLPSPRLDVPASRSRSRLQGQH